MTDTPEDVEGLRQALADARAEAATARASTPVRAFKRRRPVRARAGCDRGPDDVRLLRLRADREARRGRHRDAGSHPAPVEGDSNRPREVHLPGLRADHATSGALPSDLTRLGGPEPAGDGSVREVRPASAAQPPGRALRP